MGEEVTQVLKLVLILYRAFRNFFCSDSNFKPIIYSQFTALENKRSYFHSQTRDFLSNRKILLSENQPLQSKGKKRITNVFNIQSRIVSSLDFAFSA